GATLSGVRFTGRDLGLFQVWVRFLPFLQTTRRRWTGTGAGFTGEGCKCGSGRPDASGSIPSNRLDAWSSCGQKITEALGIDGQIRWATAGDQVAVDDHRLIHPDGARVFHVVPDTGGGRDPLSFQNLGRYQHPSGVTNLPDRLSGFVKGADRLEHPRVAAQFIRSPSAGDQQTVIGSGIHFRKGEVRRCRDSVLSFIYGTLLRADQ